jgi:hypothetical protein
MDHDLAEEYQFELGSDFATLERTGNYEFEADPNMSYDDDPYGEIYEDAVYGGKADPETTQHFFIYDVEWDGDEEPQAVEELGDELDSVFEGWIINEDGERVFALRDNKPGE